VDELRRRLAQAEPEPYDLYVVAKTGTPAVDKYVSSTQQRLVLRLFSAGDLRWDRNAGRFSLGPTAEARVRREAGPGALRWLRQEVLAPMERDPDAYTVVDDAPVPRHPLYFDASGRLRAREIRDRIIERQGGALILGFLAVPRAQGRDAAARLEDWVSACAGDGLRRAILEVPPAELIEAETAVALTAAFYIDDLAIGEGSPRAIELAEAAWDAIGEELVRRVEAARP
jgi:hypothetical protein